MTFEARDSAAKVVPARFKLSTNSRGRNSGPGSRRTTTSKQVFRKNTQHFFLSLLCLMLSLLSQ